MIKLLPVLIFCLICDLSLASQGSGNYEYISIASGATLRLDVNEMTIRDGHSVIIVGGCVQKLRYKCLVSEGGSFVFPTWQLKEQMTWEYNDQKFYVVKKVRGQLFGRKYSGFMVQSHKGDDDYWFLFSRSTGLLAFGALDKSNTSTFFLKGKCGFAAADSCEERTKR
jgi:hypothetical protein